MGLLRRAISFRRLFMRVLHIDNGVADQSRHALKKGNKIILLPFDYGKIIETKGRLPHIVERGAECKYCPKCKEWRHLRCFIKNKFAPDGLKDKCRTCYNKERREKYAKTKAVN